jgi:hypothetical protein
MSVKKSMKAWHFDKAALAKSFARVKNSIHFGWDDGATTTILVVTGVAAAVMLSAALRSRQPGDAAAANAQSKTVTAQVQTTDATTAATSGTKAAAPQTPVTITGCLEQDKDAFRLKDTSGSNAPKSRSWKSGFLKKKAASIEIIDAANKAQLPNHVGEQVAITGMLVDREMQVRSLRRLSSSCKEA